MTAVPAPEAFLPAGKCRLPADLQAKPGGPVPERRLLQRLCTGLLAGFLGFASPASSEPGPDEADRASRPLRIAVESTLDPAFFVGSFGPTIASLRKTLPSLAFRTEFLTLEEIGRALEDRRIDFFIAESGFFSFARERHGVRDLAVRTTAMSSSPARTTSTTVIVRGDSPIRRIDELQGGSVVAESASSFGGWTVLQGILGRRGYDPERFFSSTLFTHAEFPDVPGIVLAGAADAGVMKACDLERTLSLHAYPPNAFRVLEPQPGSELRCLRSGPLYPDIVFASTPDAAPEAVRRVSVALLSMSPSAEGDAWGVCTDYASVDEVFRTLRIGPYRYLREFNWSVLWEQYRQWLLGVLALLLLGALHVVRTNRLVRIRTAQLCSSLERQSRLEKEARSARQRLSRMEQMSVVSQMSMMLAHEVRQPLAAIINYAGGLRMHVARKFGGDPVVETASRALTEEARRISGIVGRVRDYARQQASKRVRVGVRQVVEQALRTFSHATVSNGVRVTVDAGPEDAVIEADPFEIELLLVNLLKNGAAAMLPESGKEDGTPAEARPCLHLGWSVRRAEGSLRFTVRDFGPALSDEAFAQLSRPIFSRKADGLGLGLSICRMIVERHAGGMSFSRMSPGLLVTVTLPLAAESRNTQESP